MKFVFTQLRRLFVAALGFSFLGTQCLFAYQPENNFWVDRRKATQKKSSLLMAALPVGPGVPGSLAAQFHAVQNLNPVFSQSLSRSAPKGFLKDHAKLLSSLSTAHGTVRKISLGQHYSPTGPVVVHIQDVHMNSEAQWNIRETLRSLMGSGQVNLVALEGATEDIPLQPFVDYPHRKPVELAADYLLKENKISGPIHAALTAQGPLPRFLGIDDAVHYQANVQAYLDSAPKLEATRKEIKTLQAEIDAQKRRDFSVALRSFDQQVQAYRTGQVSLGDYVQTLMGSLFSQRVNGKSPLPHFAKGGQGGFAVGPELSLLPIRTFLQALQIERTLDFHQVETQRARLVEQLASRLTSTEIQSLVAQTVAHRSGELGYADFYAHLKNLCQKQGIRFSDYPAMDAYVRYVLLAEEMNAESLLENMAVLEKTAYTRLAVTPKEKALVDRSRRAWLMGKLVDFSLIPSEWREYKGATPNEGRLDLASFESFYQEAQARDDAMSKKVLGTIVSGPPSSVTVLVTGGFHAERMAEQLTRQGVSVLSYVPKINKIDTAQGSTYLSVFTQEKTPLEKLFQGEKLFLAQKPIHYSTLRMECPALVVMATVIVLGGPLSITFDPQMAYALLGGLGLFAIQKTIGFDTVAGTVRSRGGKVFLKLQNGKNNISSFVAETPSTQNIFGKAVSTAQWLFMFLTRGDSSHTAHPSKDMTPGGGKNNPWKVILFDPLREQAKWFVLLLGGGTYLLASNSVLYVGGGFPLFFLALGVFGVLLTKGIVPLFLETEHPSYSEEQIMALVPIAEKISYWTLGAFILTYFALCPWGLNGVAEMGQFLSFISSPDAKIFVLSSIVGYVAGVAKHMMHNARTFSALEGRNLQFLRRGTLLPLSRAAAGNLATGPVAPHIKYPLNSSKREEILSSYYDLVANSLSTRTRQELVMEIVEKIKNDNNPFYLDYRSLLDDSARLNTDFPLLLYLVNLGIFAPLHANPFGYLNPPSQRGERWINLDPKGWDGMYYLGEPLYWSFGSDPNDFRWGNGDGIGVLQKPMDFIENFKKYFTKVSLPEVDITVGPTRTPPSGALFKGLHEKTVGFFEGDDPLSPAEMGDWVEAGRIGDRESLIQLLKDNSYARLLQNSTNGTHSDLVGLDAAVELTVSRRSALRDDRGDIVFPRTQLIMIAQKLRGLQSMLKYLSQKGQKKLALVIFYREMATVYGTPKNPIHAGIIKMISSGDYKDESTMVDFLESKGIEQALKEVQKLILSLFRSNFVSDSERESVIAGLKIAEKRRIGDKAVVAPKQKEPESLPANKPPVGELHVSLPDFITFRVNSSEKSTRIIERYFKNLSEVFRAGPDEKRELIEHIVADIRKLNTVFSTRYSGLLSDTPEMASNPELFMTLVNFAIFVPLGYCIDSNSDPTQPPEGYFQIDKKKWRAKEKFGQTVLYVSVIPKSPRAELARGVTLGVGVMNTTSTEEDAIGMSKRFIRSATALNIAQLKNIKENPAILSLLSQWVLNNSLAEGEKIAFKKRALMNSINHEKEVAVIDVLEEEAFVRAKLGTDHGGFDFRPVPLAMIREANLKNDSVLSHESDDTVLAVKTGLISMSSVGRFLTEQGESPLGTAQLLLFLEKLLISPQGSAERKICDVMFGKAATPQTVAQELFEQGDWKTWLPWIIKLCDTARNNNFYSYEEQSAIIDEIQKARATQTVVDVPGNLFPIRMNPLRSRGRFRQTLARINSFPLRLANRILLP
ncbi:MAG: hypothetical protein IPN90_03120 [Elusimicrobia bacterium]|nr:hypothetical protein [Elusimicrobiota bacterium]